MRRRSWILAIVAVVAFAAGVTASGIAVVVARGPSDRERSRAATDRPCARQYVELATRELSKSGLRLESVGFADEPATLAVDPSGIAPTLLAERKGKVRVVEDGRITSDVVLDLRDTSDHGDGGLLGLAFDPGGSWLYALRTEADQDDVLTAYPLGDAGRPDQSGEVTLLHSGHGPSEQHHGGGLVFGPDGMLYVGIGDGGGLGDPGEHAQDGGTLLGKILRIDPTPGEAEPYRVPPDNPFVDRDGWRPEIWAYGVRNPYRMTFDAMTGDLWVGDVGQSCWEELDRLTADDAGANLGWDIYEGTLPFEGGHVGGRSVWPEQTYAHRRGWCALVMGPVVHDSQLPSIDGWALHTDYCRGRIMAFRPSDGTDPPALLDTGLRAERPVSIVPGPDGTPWVLSLEGEVSRIVPRED